MNNFVFLILCDFMEDRENSLNKKMIGYYEIGWNSILLVNFIKKTCMC